MLVNNNAELLLIGCTAWFENKKISSTHVVGKSRKKLKKERCCKHLAAPTPISRPMTIHSAGVRRKGNRINTRWWPN
jgi:hypothetical protein